MSKAAREFSIDASGQHYSELNQKLREAVAGGARDVTIRNVIGQRYIGTNLYGTADSAELARVKIRIDGTPGNDLGAFLDGPGITVYGNVMDGTGNTMNAGRVIVHGRAGDITGFSARGGEVFIRDNAGYRVGIHMKEYMEKRPVIVIGGTTQDFLGEYMAGGAIIVMGLTLPDGVPHSCSHIGTGMHGGAILVRGKLVDHNISTDVGPAELTPADEVLLSNYVAKYGELLGVDVSGIEASQFTKLGPLSSRPYKQLYAY